METTLVAFGCVLGRESCILVIKKSEGNCGWTEFSFEKVSLVITFLGEGVHAQKHSPEFS